MNTRNVKLSKGFRAKTTKTILAILLFIIVYFVILGLAVALTMACFYFAYKMLSISISFLTIVLGIGLAGLGILILFFLLKFIFKVNRQDRSHLLEINRKDEPELFRMIDEIVRKVKTSFPKKVYLSSDVNAAVFYDSSFWSMFLPIKKNLIIGLGLVNSITEEELVSILSHEFGHFSQDSMRVGSYVYNVNQIIYNLLFDNESFQKLVYSLSQIGYFSIFLFIAVKIIEGIQWILRMMYGVVNKSYMGLSREMEFHADEIAASVTGPGPLISSLLRLDLAETSFNNATGFYDNRIKDNKKSDNIFKEQFYIMSLFAKKNKLDFNNELPAVSFDEIKKFDKSKLVIDNQWASHPTLEQRIKNLSSLQNSTEGNKSKLANEIFSNIDLRQVQLTKKLFEQVKYKGDVELIPFNRFKELFDNEFQKNSFDEIYNGFYDNYNPQPFDLDIKEQVKEIDFENFYSDDKKEQVQSLLHLRNDLVTIQQIKDKVIPVKTFDYDGIKYKRKACKTLIQKLNQEISTFEKKMGENDKKIYQYFLNIESKLNSQLKLEELYSQFFTFDKEFESQINLYNELINGTQFFQYQLSSDQILECISVLKNAEKKLKQSVRLFQSNDLYSEQLTIEMKEKFDTFLLYDWDYFRNGTYQEKNIELLFEIINNYYIVIHSTYFQLKKQFLDYQVELLKLKR